MEKNEIWNKGLEKKKRHSFKKGHTPWNKGLTKETDKRIKMLGEKMKKIKKHKFQDESYKKRYLIKNKGIFKKGNISIAPFKKGHKSWNKGVPCSEETKAKLRIAHLGKKFSIEHRNKIGQSQKGEKNNMYGKHLRGKDSWMFGKKHSEETKRKIGLKSLGRIHSIEQRRKNSLSNMGKLSNKKGKTWKELYGEDKANKMKKEMIKRQKGRTGFKHSEETKLKMSESRTGEKHWNFGKKQSIETINKKIIKLTGKKRSEETKQKMRDSYTDERRKITGERTRRLIKEGIIVTPKKDTSIEVKIQNFLKQLGIEFFTHQYMKEIEHGYQCDILIPSMNIVIEADGDYWHKYPIGNDIDHVRTKELIEKGFKVLRLWEHDIRSMKINKFKERLNEI